jgi:hypothetical protein
MKWKELVVLGLHVFFNRRPGMRVAGLQRQSEAKLKWVGQTSERGKKKFSSGARHASRQGTACKLGPTLHATNQSGGIGCAPTTTGGNAFLEEEAKAMAQHLAICSPRQIGTGWRGSSSCARRRCAVTLA